jgi:hypothetical protein
MNKFAVSRSSCVCDDIFIDSTTDVIKISLLFNGVKSKEDEELRATYVDVNLCAFIFFPPTLLYPCRYLLEITPFQSFSKTS